MNIRMPPSLGRDYIALPWSPKIVEHCIVDLSMSELSGFADGLVPSLSTFIVSGWPSGSIG